MASELRVNTLKDASGNNSIATSFVAGGSAKSHITFDSETGSVSTKVSLNASSLTDNAEGDFTHNLPSAFGSNTKFTQASSGTDGYNFHTNLKTSGTITSSAIPIQTRTGSQTLNDTTYGMFVFHGELA